MAVFVHVVFEGRVENGHNFENIIFRVPAIFNKTKYTMDPGIYFLMKTNK